MKVLVMNTKNKYETLGEKGRLLLESKGYELIYNTTGEKVFPKDVLYSLLPTVDAIIATNYKIDAEFLEKAPRLKVIARYGAGIDNIDLESAEKKGIKVVSAKGGNSSAVAEFAVALMLSLLRSIPNQDSNTKKNGWYRKMGEELGCKIVGIVGFGEIGRRVAAIVKAFGSEVIAYDPYPDEIAARNLGVELTELKDLVKRADIVSLHMPFSKSNYHFFNESVFSSMKQGSYFINTSRGGLVDEDSLCDALDSKHLAGAGLDVFNHEPLKGEERILHTDNLITTSHSGAETKEAYARISVITANAIIDVLEKENTTTI